MARLFSDNNSLQSPFLLNVPLVVVEVDLDGDFLKDPSTYKNAHQLVSQLPQDCAEDVLNILQDSQTPLALELRRMLRASYEQDNDLNLTVSAALPNAVEELHQDSSPDRTQGSFSSGQSAIQHRARMLLEKASQVRT